MTTAFLLASSLLIASDTVRSLAIAPAIVSKQTLEARVSHRSRGKNMIPSLTGPVGSMRRGVAAVSAGSRWPAFGDRHARCRRRKGSVLRMLAATASLEDHETFVANVQAMRGDPLEAAGGRVVVYRGNPKARLMMVGEAPGAEEDKLGVPFVGRSGQLLNAILNAVGVDPERDVYVTNIVRRRPPDNRPPTTEEMDFYLPMLLEEIEVVNPDIIVTLGASSTKALIPHEERGITKMRGQWVPNEELVKSHGGALYGKLLMPWFHPSYLLRNAGESSKQEGGVRWLTREDLREVKRVLDRLNS